MPPPAMYRHGIKISRFQPFLKTSHRPPWPKRPRTPYSPPGQHLPVITICQVNVPLKSSFKCLLMMGV